MRTNFINREDGNKDETIVSVSAVVHAAWRQRFDTAPARAGIHVEFFPAADDLALALAADWSGTREVVVLDLALATEALAARLGPDGPRLLAFGSAENAGVALGANLAGFLDDDITPEALATTIAAAMVPALPMRVADLSDRSVARMGMLGAEVARVAEALARIGAAEVVPVPLDAARLRAMIQARRQRDRFFTAELFGEPAWDMLLDLAVAAAEGRDVAVSSLCIAAAVPTTTALRHIKALCDARLFDRRADPRDARRAFVSLSPGARTAMGGYLAATG